MFDKAGKGKQTQFFQIGLHMERKIMPGQDLVMVGEVGTYARDRLLELRYDRIRERFSRVYLNEELNKIKSQNEVMDEWYNSAREARAAQSEFDPIEVVMPGYQKEYGVTKICMVEKGGVLKALWDFCESESIDSETGKRRGEGAGCEFRYDRIPISQFTMELCEVFDLFPYRLWSEKCFIMSMDKGAHFCEDFLRIQLEMSKKLADETFAKGGRTGFDSEQHVRTTEPVKAAVFGRFIKGKKRIRTDGTETGYLTKESYEELERFLNGEKRM